MESSFSNIKKIEEFIQKGNYTKAFNEVQNARKNPQSKKEVAYLKLLEYIIQGKLGNYSVISKIENLLKEDLVVNDPDLFTKSTLSAIEIYGNRGEFDKGLEHINKMKDRLFEERGIKIQKQDEASFYLHYSSLLQGKGKLKEAEESCIKSYQIFKEINSKFESGRALCKLSGIQRNQGKIDQAKKNIRASMDLLSSIGNKHEIAYCLNNKAGIARFCGNTEKALQDYKEALVLVREIGNKQDEAMIMNNIAVIYHDRSDLDSCLKYFLKSLNIHRELNNKNDIAMSLNNLGWIHLEKGELIKALEILRESLELLQEIGNIQYEAYCLHNIGKIYYERGEIELAKNYYEKSLAIFDKIGNNYYKAIILSRFGRMSLDKDELEKGEEFLNQSIKIFKELGNNRELSHALFLLIRVYLEWDLQVKAEDVFKQLEKIQANEKNPLIDQRLRIASGLMLKYSSRIRDNFRALDIFDKLINEEVINHELTTFALVNSISLRLKELEITENESVLVELEGLIEFLKSIGETQNSAKILVQSLWFESQHALLKRNITKARAFLNQAQIIAEEKGLIGLAVKISEEHDQLLNKLNEFDDLLAEDPSYKEIINYTDIENKIKQIIQKGEVKISKRENEKPIYLIIFEKNGNTLFSKKFIEVKELDEHLVGGLLSAINTFMQEAFSSEGHIERIKQGEFNLISKAKNIFLFSYVYKGQSYQAIRKLNSFINALTENKHIWETMIEISQSSLQFDPEVKKEVENEIDNIF